jgi:hypothetical protein
VHVVHIPKNHLMLIAGLVWCAAGAMVCMIGLPMIRPFDAVLLRLMSASAARSAPLPIQRRLHREHRLD